MKIDLNADLGEGCANDSALLQLVSSANIACGFHAGDAVMMLQCVREALKYGVAVGLAGSELIRAGQRYQLTTRQEVFADRGYLADGSLVPRTQPGALIESEEQSLAQTLEMVQHSRVRSITGEWAHVVAETVCLHGDGEHALDFARRLRAAFAGRNIQVSAEAEE